MYHEFFVGRTILSWPILAMFLFLFAFVAVVVRALRVEDRQVRTLSNLPLSPEDSHE